MKDPEKLLNENEVAFLSPSSAWTFRSRFG